MSDQLDKLKQVFTDAPEIKAQDAAKRAAISAAMSAFAEEKSKIGQGNDIDNRHKDQDNKNVVLVTLSRWRNAMKLNYILPGTAVLATVALVAVNTFQFESLFAPEVLEAEQRNEAKVRARAIQKQEAEQLKRKKSLPLEYEQAMVALEAAPTAAKTSMPMPMPMPKLVDSRAGANLPYESYKEYPEKKSQSILKRTIISSKMAKDSSSMMVTGDRFAQPQENPLKLASETPVSTFSIDVDTASYSYLRASLNRGQLPAKDAVRIEELLNYFPYDYPVPGERKLPFSLNTTLIPTPWNSNTQLLHIGIKGFEIRSEVKPAANLVFLLDTSGSMNQPDKLPLLISSFRLLLDSLAAEDSVSIVSYAGSAGVVLEPTQVKNRAVIINALTRLEAGGSTAGGEGIELAYQLAQQSFKPEGINRVILATDGDFNVGISDPTALKQYIENKRDSGVFLSVLGFGTGNYHDALMQTLAQNGNGNAAYIDSLSEARKVLVEEASSTLFPIAKDVKIQMEFNPAVVSEYRLIGYESRQLNREDFNNDKVDAGDIGAGHTVTAIYEITPVGSDAKRIDGLRYQDKAQPQGSNAEVGYLKLRYKLPDQDKSQLIERAVRVEEGLNALEQASDDVRFSVAVAAYGQLLRASPYMEAYSDEDVIALALGSRGEDEFGYRNEFISLVRLSRTLGQ